MLRAEDGRGPATALTGIVLNALGYPSTEAMLRARIAGELNDRSAAVLCPLVFEVADRGDDVAAGLIVTHGQALAEYATAAIRRFGMQDLEFDVVLCGSVFKGEGSLLIDTITQEIHRVAPHANIVTARFEPAVGGVLLAYDALNIAVTDRRRIMCARTRPAPVRTHWPSSTRGGCVQRNDHQ